jgi:hypothetical protein
MLTNFSWRTNLADERDAPDPEHACEEASGYVF